MSELNKNQLENVDYQMSFLKRPKWILGLIGIFFITIFMYFPIGKKIDAQIYKALGSIPGCPLQMDDYEVGYFPPRVEINNLKVPGRCAGGKSINLKKLTAKFRFFNFSPFGPHFLIETKLFGNPIEANLTLGTGSIAVLLNNSKSSPVNKVNLKSISHLLPQFKIAGDIHLTHVKAELNYGGKLKDLQLNIASNNLIIPSQMVVILQLSALNLKDLHLQATMNSRNVLKIKKLVIGNTEAPINANFAGTLKLNSSNMRASSANLLGELMLSDQFLEKYPIGGMLQKFDKKDKFYQIQINGQLGSMASYSSPR